MTGGTQHYGRYRRTLTDPMVAANPITVHVLGLCSALAVSISLVPALIMCAAVVSVLTFANVAVSMLRHVMPHSIRLIIEVTLIATAVIVVDEVLKAFAPDVSEVLSVFVGLIITNCIVLARVESFAMHNGVWASFLDGLGNGLGYSWVLITVAAVREILGSASLLDYPIPGLHAPDGWFQPNQFMLTSPSAFFLVALIIWALHALWARKSKPDTQANGAASREGPP